MQEELTYREEVAAQKNPYAQWIKEQEGTEDVLTAAKEQAWEYFLKDAKEKQIQVIRYRECQEKIVPEQEYVLYIDEQGIPSKQMLEAIRKAFEHPEVLMVYGDEDILGEDGKRTDPWFKPDWSPDTLRSYFYLGSAFALRRKMAEKLKAATPYRTALKMAETLDQLQIDGRQAVFHSDCIWYHKITMREGTTNKESNGGTNKERLLLNGNESLVSIIIPSKDNENVLEKCLSTLREKTEQQAIEIIVVDNGSKEENKKRLETMKVKYGFNYLHIPMEFNFSAMCNAGVREAKGEYILLLNDDMEIIQPDWLSLMIEKAKLPHVGAVGAKLLYPNSNIIQHVGVTNLEIGPAHKLTTVADEGMIYHGVNHYAINMIAVTAACLLIRKDKYQRAGGMCEDLKVAYNDVDFCFTLYEQGYYNVQHNGVVLYHHESLSRGDDISTAKKYDRLLEEKDKLYARHPSLYKKDPFYSRHLVINSPYYTCNFLYPYEDKTYFLEPDKREKQRILPRNFLNIHYHIDHAELEQKMEKADISHYYIDGWSFVNKYDNANFKTYLLLENHKKKYWRFPVTRRFREDVIPVAANQVNAELSGFALRFKQGEIPGGTYQIVLLKKHIPTGMNYYQMTENSIIIEETDRS